MSTEKSRNWLKVVLPLLILIAGGIGMRAMVLSRQAPPKQVRESPGALVETLPAIRSDQTVTVSGTGTVQPRREVTMTPQVGGKVITVSPNLVAGGLLRKGELLFAIEATDYRLAVDRAKAALTRAEVDLATVESRARVARQEWRELDLDDSAEPNPLALYEPQLKDARASVASARAALRQAELDLERTRLHAPFNALVASEQVEEGLVVRPGTSVASLSGTDTAEIVVPLPVEELRWLNIPSPGGAKSGSPATVRFEAGELSHRWPGAIVRSLGDVDPRGRMARVVVAVEDPYGLLSRKDEAPELKMGMFVEVDFEGKRIADVAVLPRRALRDGDTVWLVDEEQRLNIRPVAVVRREKEHVLIGKGLPEGAQVVLTYLPGAADGMKLRPVEQGASR